MSASPSSAAAATTNQKRPLEEPSSPSAPDQPDAKRQALDKVASEDVPKTEESSTAAVAEATAATTDGVDLVATKDEQTVVPAANGTQDGLGDTVVPDAPSAAGAAILETQPIQSTAAQANGRADSQGAMPHQDETGWLHMRAIISSAEAATIIGKGGENVTLIRRMSGAKCTVSDYSRGAVERILTVSGQVDAVAKVGRIRQSLAECVANVSGLRSHHSHVEQRSA